MDDESKLHSIIETKKPTLFYRIGFSLSVKISEISVISAQRQSVFSAHQEHLLHLNEIPFSRFDDQTIEIGTAW